MKKIHFGCGWNFLEGWDNTDMVIPPNLTKEQEQRIKIIDVTQTLPYESDSVDFIFHEHMIEHIDEVDGYSFLNECYRILKPGGVMRISCPSIDGAMDVYHNWDNVSDEWKQESGLVTKARFINHFIYYETAGYQGKKFEADGSIKMVNNPNYWHKYMYDREDFDYKLKYIGFSDVNFVNKHESQYSELKGLERRFCCKFKLWPIESDITLETKK